MNYSSPLRRRSLRAVSASLLAYLLLGAQVAPLALAAAPARARAAAAASAPPAAPESAKAAPVPQPLALAPMISATKTDSFPDPNNNQKAEPGDIITYTVTVKNAAAGTDAEGVSFSDNLDVNTTLVAGSIKVAPLARNDAYETFGNTLLEVGVAASGNPAVRVTDTAKDSVFDNDTEFAGDTFSFDIVTQNPTKGTLTFNSDGTFSYQPNAGQTGTDTFKYRIKDPGGLTDEGTVTITISAPEIWYVKNDVAGPGTGTSSDPFKALSSADTASGAGDTVYVFFGDGTSASQNTGITLAANQRLIGEGVELDVPVSVNGGPNPTVLRTHGSQPSITSTAVGSSGVSLVSVAGVQIRGLNIGGNVNAIAATFVSAGGGLTVSHNTLTGGAGNGVDVTTTGSGGATVEIANNVVPGATLEGLDINGNGTGTLTLSLHDNTASSSGSNAIDVNRGASGGNLIITAFDDNTASGFTFGSGIVVVGSGSTSVLFDANPGTPAFDAVSWGTTTVGSAGAGNGVGANGVQLTNVRGDLTFPELDVYTDNGTALLVVGTSPNYTGTSGTRLTANTGTPTLVATGGAAANVSDANINLVPATLSSTNSTASGVALTTVGGTFTAPSGSTITNAANADFLINGSGNANADVDVTYPGTITDDTGALVSIANVTAASTHVFSGAITDNFDGDGGEAGITLTANSGANITFSGGLSIRTTTNAAFTATGGGTLTITDPAGAPVNRLQTTTGTALNVANTNIGSGGLTFESISSSGAPSGIILNATGTAAGNGGLTVTGNGGVCTLATQTCTGGSIQSSTGAGVSLTSTRAVNLSLMKVQNSGGDGFNTSGVNGFTLDNSIVTDSAGAVGQDGIDMTNTSGALSITNSVVSSAPDFQIKVDNLNTNMASFTLSNSTVQCVAGSTCQPAGSTGNSGLLLQMRGTSVLTSGSVSGSTFSGLRATGVFVITTDTARIGNASGGVITAPNASNSITIQGNTFTGNNIGIDVSQSQVSNSAFQILSNTITGCNSHAMNIATATGSDTGPASHFHVGKVDGNFIGTQGTRDSGSRIGVGIRVVIQGSNTQGSVSVTNNTIREVANGNIITLIGQNGSGVAGTGSAKFNVTGNQMPAPSGSNQNLCGPAATPCAENGIFVLADEAFPVCVNITGNTIYDVTTMNGTADVYLSERTGPPAGAQLTVQGSGDPVTYVTANNTLAGPSKVINPGGGATTVASCGSFTAALTSTSSEELAAAGETQRQVAAPATAGAKFGAAASATLPLFAERTREMASIDGRPSADEQTPAAAKSKRHGGTTLSHTKGASAAPLGGDAPAATKLSPAPAAAFAGENVTVSLGTLKPGDEVVITFQAQVANPYTGPANVENQGSVSGTNFSTVLTDDPDTGTANDKTLTPINIIKMAIRDAVATEPPTGSTNMIFTVTLNAAPAPMSTVSVNFTTAPDTTGTNPATEGVDYSSTSGTVTFNGGERVKTINVPVLGNDGQSPEPDETFLVNLTVPATGADVIRAQAVGTIRQTTPASPLIISELRTSGPLGATDEFVEIYNNTDADIVISSADTPSGYGVFKMGADCTGSMELVGVIPNGTTIPARGHFLLVGSGYVPANYNGPAGVAGDGAGLTSDIENDRNVGLFSTADLANVSSLNRLDAVGFGANNQQVCDLLREGTGLAPMAGSTLDYTFFRDECGKSGSITTFGPCPTGGEYADFNNNATDFIFADTTGVSTPAGQRLGTPGPQNLASPVVNNANVPALSLDQSQCSTCAPNRVRSMDPDGTNTKGTITIRKRVVNNTTSPLTKLRFRIIDVTTKPAPGTADVRARSSADTPGVQIFNDPATCNNVSGACTVTVKGTSIGTTPAQPDGGGFNATWTVSLSTPLQPGQSVNIQLVLGVMQGGSYRFLFNTEAGQ